MASLASINIKFTADLASLSTAMQQVNRDLTKVGKQMQNVGKTLSIGVTAPIVALGYQSVKAFDIQAKAIAQVEQGLKSTGGTAGYTSEQLQKMASELQNNSLFGDEAILKDVTAQLLTFTNISGKAFAGTQQAALDLATRLDGDLKSATIQLGKALNDPKANLSALSRSGIQFSEDQKKVIASLQDSGRLAEAQTIILAELEKQYGGSAKAAAEAGTGPLKQLSNSLGDLLEQFGAIIADGIKPLVTYLQGLVARFQELSPETKKIIVIVAAVAAAIGPLILVLGTVMTLLPGITAGLAAMGSAFTLMTGPIGLVVAAIGALIYLIVRNWDKVKKALIDTANYFIDLYNESTLFRAGVEYIIMTFKNLFAVVKTVVNFIIDGFKLVGKQIYNTFSTVGKVIKAVLTGNLKEIPSILTNGFKDAVKNGKEFAKELSDDFKNGADEISKNIGSAIDNTFKGRKVKLLSEDVDASGVKDAVAEGTEEGVVMGLSNGIAKGTKALKFGTEVFFEKQISDLKELQSTLADSNYEWQLYQQRIDEVQKKLEDLQKPLQSVQELVKMPEIDNSEYTKKLIENSEYFKNMVTTIGEQGEELKAKQDALNAEMTAKAQALNDAYQTIGDAFTDLFGSYARGFVDSLNITNEGMKSFVQGLVGTITKLIAMALSASMANSIQGATQSGAATGPGAVVATPAFIATAIAGVLAAFAAIPKFELGGVVGGTSFFGDKILARINSGELILNQKQQSRLYDMMQPMAMGNTEISLGLGTRISGSDLEIVIDRAVKKNLRKK